MHRLSCASRSLIKAAATLAVASLGIAESVHAQSLSPEVGLGVAVPTGSFGRHRSIGPLADVGVVLGAPTRRVRLRISGEAMFLPGEMPAEPPNSSYGDARVLSVLGTLLMGPRGSGRGVYGIVGVGRQRLKVESQANPYGWSTGVRAGVGVRWPLAGSLVRVELTPHLILSDHGSASEYSAGSYWPVRVAWTF